MERSFCGSPGQTQRRGPRQAWLPSGLIPQAREAAQRGRGEAPPEAFAPGDPNPPRPQVPGAAAPASPGLGGGAGAGRDAPAPSPPGSGRFSSATFAEPGVLSVCHAAPPLARTSRELRSCRARLQGLQAPFLRGAQWWFSLTGEPGGSALRRKRRWGPGGRPRALGARRVCSLPRSRRPARCSPLGRFSERCTRAVETSTLTGTRPFVPSFLLRETGVKLPSGVFQRADGDQSRRERRLLGRPGAWPCRSPSPVLEAGGRARLRLAPGPWPRAGGPAPLCLPGAFRDTEAIRGGGRVLLGLVARAPPTRRLTSQKCS